MMNDLKNKVDNRILELQKYAKSTWNLDVQVSISYALDSARAVGSYQPLYKRILLNEKLLEEYGELYIEDTVVHEFVHAVIHCLYPSGRDGWGKKVHHHGKQFRAVCSHYGNDGSARTALFNDSKTMKKPKRHRRFTYKCGCNTHEISTVRHNRIQSGKQSFRCNKCSSSLTLV